MNENEKKALLKHFCELGETYNRRTIAAALDKARKTRGLSNHWYYGAQYRDMHTRIISGIRLRNRALQLIREHGRFHSILNPYPVTL